MFISFQVVKTEEKKTSQSFFFQPVKFFFSCCLKMKILVKKIVDSEFKQMNYQNVLYGFATYVKVASTLVFHEY